MSESEKTGATLEQKLDAMLSAVREFVEAQARGAVERYRVMVVANGDGPPVVHSETMNVDDADVGPA